ncbi:hypothetical protein QC761_0047070 [Podospora bellae-mahoneyi]|uniref:Uncharacterized protein n=1 Tax=Podospora bellae-mahoneyi TaxID=2093777 RepID=A0ABR0FLF7_9PEZI|nr:hypothetical protein QC761_0047070 [Podospora bellae-mahoneyi]
MKGNVGSNMYRASRGEGNELPKLGVLRSNRPCLVNLIKLEPANNLNASLRSKPQHARLGHLDNLLGVSPVIHVLPLDRQALPYNHGIRYRETLWEHAHKRGPPIVPQGLEAAAHMGASCCSSRTDIKNLHISPHDNDLPGPHRDSNLYRSTAKLARSRRNNHPLPRPQPDTLPPPQHNKLHRQLQQILDTVTQPTIPLWLTKPLLIQRLDVLQRCKDILGIRAILPVLLDPLPAGGHSAVKRAPNSLDLVRVVPRPEKGLDHDELADGEGGGVRAGLDYAADGVPPAEDHVGGKGETYFSRVDVVDLLGNLGGEDAD